MARISKRTPLAMLLALALSATSLIVPGDSSAVVTFGSTLASTPTSSAGTCGPDPCTVVLNALPAANTAPGGVFAPAAGVVVRWRIKTGAMVVPIKPRITRPGGFVNQTGAGTGPEVTPPPNATTAFAVRLPVQAGDAIGLDRSTVVLTAQASTASATVRAYVPPLVDNASPTPQFSATGGAELTINADLEGDGDADGFGDESQDNCTGVANPGQEDADGDFRGDLCDDDADGDGFANTFEQQRGTDPLRADTDGDGSSDPLDNCATAANADQADADGDGRGDACDPTPFLPGPAPGRCANAQVGTDGGDTLAGSAFGDTLIGLEGDDRLSGFDGEDCLDGGGGRDRLLGGIGNDALQGGEGNDTLSGEGGRDRMSGGDGNDKLSGGDDNDRLSGSEGNDSLKGGAGKNSYLGGSGRDRISAANGRRETVNCGPDRDRATVDRSDKVKGCERVTRVG